MKFDIKEEDLIIKPYKTEGPIYVRSQKGKYQKLRRYIGWALMLAFILIPFIPYQGQQAILLDIGAQQFRFFNTTLFPQDFTLLAWIFMAGAFALFFVTTWLGRVWCGYTCPQTVWMMMFIWVEEKVEGNRNKRIKLDKSPMSFEKFRKKGLKHLAWLSISFLTATTFLSYFVPVKELYSNLVTLDWSGLIWFWVGLFAVCTYGNAGFLREKMCIYMCPYSRFQAVMFDKDTYVVAYDEKRGESRGRRKRKDDPKQLGLGDCVDCNLCVEVCPAGIDIRNGMQYECINCGACIDACDETMDKFNYQKGLISYTSEHQLAGQKTNKFRLKLVGYGFFTGLVIVTMLIWINLRVPIETSILRDRNALYRVNYEGLTENTYTLRITNKTQNTLNYTLTLLEDSRFVLSAPQNIVIPAGEMSQFPVTITADGYDLKQKVTDVRFKVQAIEQPDIQIIKQSKFYKP